MTDRDHRRARDPIVRPGLPADRGAVVDTVVAAFAADPAFRFFFADEASFTAQAAVFAGWLFDRRVDRGGVWVVDDGSAVAMWDPPDDGHGRWRLPDLPGPTLDRLRAYDDALTPVLPREPHWYLGVLATRPDRAGERLGRLVMSAGLESAGRAGLTSVLETVNDRNVGLYERSGWSVVAVASVGPLTVRVMAHPPNPGGDLATAPAAG